MRSGRASRSRPGLAVVNNGDFAALALDGSVRRGVDITVTVAGQPIRLLSVHLKSGCFAVPLSTPGNDCEKLLRQVPLLEGWIDQRTQEGVPFAILGDWNRRFDAEPGQEFWREIDDGLPAPLDLLRVTEGVEAHCPSAPGFDEFIDHIVLDEQAARWMVDGSFSQFQYRPEDAAFFDRLSDHCPIRVALEVAEGEEPVAAGRDEEIRRLLGEILQRVGRIGQLLPLLVARGDAPELLEPVDQPLDPVARAVGLAVEARAAGLPSPGSGSPRRCRGGAGRRGPAGR